MLASVPSATRPVPERVTFAVAIFVSKVVAFTDVSSMSSSRFVVAVLPAPAVFIFVPPASVNTPAEGVASPESVENVEDIVPPVFKSIALTKGLGCIEKYLRALIS
jgi:hypothetical protein